MCGGSQRLVCGIRSHNDAGRIEVVVQRSALPEKFRAEQDVLTVVLFPDGLGIAHRNGRLDDHDCIRIAGQHQFDHCLYRRGIEKVFAAVIVGGCGDDNEIRLAVCCRSVQRCSQIQVFFCQILLDLRINDGRFPLVDEFHLFRNDVYCQHLVMLCQQDGVGKSHIAGSCHCNCIFFLHVLLPHIQAWFCILSTCHVRTAQAL